MLPSFLPATELGSAGAPKVDPGASQSGERKYGFGFHKLRRYRTFARIPLTSSKTTLLLKRLQTLASAVTINKSKTKQCPFAAWTEYP
ncbi:hypothetical protein TNCV_1175831 [Trichonephila clavipes]|nr:hypothetical protein TNCV_1175831 [Trichonephila clavipes]